MNKTSIFFIAQYPCITRSCSTYQIIKGLFMTGTFRISMLLSCCKTNQLLYSNFWHKLNYFLNGYVEPVCYEKKLHLFHIGRPNKLFSGSNSMQIKKKSLFQSFLPSKFIDHLVNFWIVQQVKSRSSPLIQSFPFNSHAHLLTLNNTNQLKFLEKRRNLIFVVKKMCTFNFSPT